MKKGSDDGEGVVLHRAQDGALGVTYLLQHGVAADSSAL